jgi:hypothetical protein
MGNSHHYIDTTITDIYMLNDDVVGIKCNPNPNTLNTIYKRTPFYKNSNHNQYDDLFLNVSDPNYEYLNENLKVGNTYNIKYNHILSKNFDDELDYKKERVVNLKLSELYYNKKIKHLNNQKRIYTNYISYIRHEPIYKTELYVFNIMDSPFKEYYEFDTYDIIKQRFLISIEMSNVIVEKSDNKYYIKYKKSNLGDNFYVVMHIAKK